MLQVVPVLDLLQQRVVRGMAGKRHAYQPIVSQLTSSTTPGEVAQALIDHFAFTHAYVADLDAIAGAPPNYAALTAIRQTGLQLWIDAGSAHGDDVSEHGEVVLGLESLRGPAHLQQCWSALAPNTAIFSLDLYEGRPWTQAAAWQGLTALEIAVCALECGARRLILLDVAAVGMHNGPGTLELAAQVHERWPEVELIGGGGVRHVEDLHAMEAAGFRYGLIASALHDGRLAPAQLRGGVLPQRS